jgi:branched-chain amino acid aminotransferase
MEKCIGSYFFKNYQLMPTSSFTEHLTDISNGIYEVIRIINKVPLFWEEHMQRLNESLALKQLPLELSPSRILKAVEQLGTANDIINGNIKLLIISKANNADNPWDQELKSAYPSWMD